MKTRNVVVNTTDLYGHPENIALVDIRSVRKCIFSMSSLGDFFASLALRQSRNYYKLGFTGNKKITLEHSDVPDVTK